MVVQHVTDTMCRGRVSAVHSVGNVLYHHATGQGPEVQLTLAGRGLDESPQRSACRAGVERSPHSDRYVVAAGRSLALEAPPATERELSVFFKFVSMRMVATVTLLLSCIWF